MPDIVGIRFKKAGKVYYFDPAGIDLKVDECAVVQTARGIEIGQVIIAPKQILASEITTELKPIVRKATEDDIKQAQSFTQKEAYALEECEKMIKRLNLPMKLVSAEYNLDGGRLTFYFTADERVDFRELVRELTAFFKTRIELRQIGPRDQAKLVGGLGRCGRVLCCGSFLTEFSPVSIKMAKEQDLPLDPMKISGVCGRLQCCLAYESFQYHEAKASMPKKGAQVTSPSGSGIVISVNPLKESVQIETESKATLEVPVSQVTILKGQPAPEQEEASQDEVSERKSRVNGKRNPEEGQPKAQNQTLEPEGIQTPNEGQAISDTRTSDEESSEAELPGAANSAEGQNPTTLPPQSETQSISEGSIEDKKPAEQNKNEQQPQAQ